MDPEIDFDLIGPPQMQTAKLSPRAIPAARLASRTLVVRTRSGSLAKMHVRSGELGLTIDRLTVYEVDSCITEMASNLKLRSGASFDVDRARESGSGGDIRWRRTGRGHVLEPLEGAALFEVPDSIGPRDLAVLRLDPKRARLSARGDRTLYCRTRTGRLAKLVVQGGGKGLRIRELIVLDEAGDVHLHQRADILLPADATLDLDSGKLGDTVHYDLRHDVEAAGSGGTYMSAADRVTFVPAHHFEMFKYNPLLQSEAIREHLVFQDSNGIKSYDEWSDARKAQLREWLYLRDTGQPFPIPGPPPLDGEKTMAGCAAWKIYLAHVVQSFWLDANRIVPWRLLDAEPEHLEHLLDGRRLIAYTVDGHRSLAMGIVTPWCPVFAYDFMADNDYIRSTQWETIKQLADWVRANLRHIWGFEFNQPGGPFDSQEDQWAWLFGYRGPPPIDRMIEPLPDRPHTTHGCSGTSGFFAAVLRSVNIPVRYGYTSFGGGSHHRPEFFTVNRNFPHGDDPYNAATLPGVNTPPIHRLFFTDAELEALIDAPEPMPGKTVGETAGYNAARWTFDLAIEYKTNWLLRMRCLDQASGASGLDSELGAALGAYYTADEIADIEADCDAALAAIPDGCGAVL